MVPRSMSDKHPPKILGGARRRSDSQRLAEAALAGGSDRDGARFAVAADPVQREAARRQLGAERAADMQAPLAPVEARPAIEAGGRAAQLHAEPPEENHPGIGHRAALGGQPDITALAERVGEPDTELAGEMVVAGPRSPHCLVARA